MICPQCSKELDLFDNYTFYRYNPHNDIRMRAILCSKECLDSYGLVQDASIHKMVKWQQTSSYQKVLELEGKLAYEKKLLAKHELIKTELEMRINSLKMEWEFELE